jgi:hypothetical protein
LFQASQLGRGEAPEISGRALLRKRT